MFLHDKWLIPLALTVIFFLIAIRSMHNKEILVTLSSEHLEVAIEGQSSEKLRVTEALPVRLALSGFNGTEFELLPLSLGSPAGVSVHAQSQPIAQLLGVQGGQQRDFGRTIRLRLICPNLTLRIRPTPSTAEDPVGFIAHGDVVNVYEALVNGFYKLVDGRVRRLTE